MGKQKYQRNIEKLFEKSPVVSFASIKKIVTHHNKNKQYTKQLVRNLLLAKKIKKITKGYYTIHNEASLAVFCFQPAYLGLQDALSYHGLWEQETIPIILTVRKVRTGLRSILGSNVCVHHLAPEYYFGIEPGSGQPFPLPYSDIEKTLIDMVYFKQNISNDVRNEFRKRINTNKLKRYLKNYPLETKQKVIGLFNKK